MSKLEKTTEDYFIAFCESQGLQVIDNNCSDFREDSDYLAIAFMVPEIQKLQEANKVLRWAVYNATSHDPTCNEELYGACCCNALYARLALAKADEIMGEEK